MKNLIFIFSVLGIVSMGSCNMQVKKERLQKIDSLGIHLNYVAETMEEVDPQLIENRINEIDQMSAWMWDNVEDTLSKQKGLAFGDLVRTTKYFKKTKSRYSQVSDEYVYTQEQLNALRKDVENSFYSEEEFKGYFKTEAASVEALVKATDELETSYDYSIDRYEKYKPTVDAMIDSIKTVIYSDDPVRK